MLKRVSFQAFFVFVFALFMTAGCAKQTVVKKDESLAPTPVATPVAQPNKSVVSGKQPDVTQVAHATPQPVSAQQSQKASSIVDLQSELEKIYFDFDSAALSESARNILTKNAAALGKENTLNVRIEGNCDERGSAEYNLALGEQRAKAAQQYLVTMGVKPDRISIVSYGKEKPAVQGSNEDAWAKNRRDEFIVTK